LDSGANCCFSFQVDLTSVATPLKLVESKIEELLAKAMDKILAPIIEKAIPAATKVVAC
jgi:hypothetical protein